MNEEGRIANEVSDFGSADKEEGREDIAEGSDVNDLREREGRDRGDDDEVEVEVDEDEDEGEDGDGDDGLDGRGVKRGDLSE